MSELSNFFPFFTCLASSQVNFYCIYMFLCNILALIIVVLSIIIIIVRHKQTQKLYQSRKQILIFMLMMSAIAYLCYNWTHKIEILYFPAYYFNYLFVIYLFYYFGRRLIITVGFDMSIRGQNVLSPVVQLKFLQFFAFGMCFCFTLIVAMNFGFFFQEKKQNGGYNLCTAQFWNIIRTLAFLLETIFLVTAFSFSKHFSVENQREDKDLLHSQLIEIRRAQYVVKELTFLIFLCFAGALIVFIQNIYYDVQIAKNIQNPCEFFHLKNSYLSWTYNDILNFLIKIVTYFWPLLLTLKIFWPRKNQRTTYFDEPEYQEYQLYKYSEEDNTTIQM